MAHVAKYQSGALGNMCAHYARTPEIEHGYMRVNIDPERMHLNYNLAPSRPGGDVAFINDRIASLELKRAPRKDAVKMCDCVLTKPKELDDSKTRKFFEEGYRFLCARYGTENVISAWVHMDETTPHMHFAWVPVTHDGRLSAKDVVNKRDLKTLHQEMQAWFNKTDLNVSVLLSDDQIGEKQLSYLNQQEYIAAKDRLECLRREIKQAEIQPAAETVSESLRTLSKARGDGKREEGLREAISGLRERIRAAEGEREQLRERIRSLKYELPRLQERFENLKRTVQLGICELIEVPKTLSKQALDFARSRGRTIVDKVDRDSLPAVNPFTHERSRSVESGPSLEREAMRATQAARALNADYQSHSRSRDLSI